MTITILTLFPHVFEPIFNTSILKKAKEKGILDITLVNIRDFAVDSYKTVDDKPYGGGVGMILRVDVLYDALKAQKKGYAILLSPTGKRYKQTDAKRLSQKKHLIILCGHYEGVDARMKEYIDEIISIGDYILTGGEIAAMAIVDSITRLLPDVLPKEALEAESFEKGLLEYPQYTRPAIFRDKKVPQILLSGNHKKIEEWRRKQQQKA